MLMFNGHDAAIKNRNLTHCIMFNKLKELLEKDYRFDTEVNIQSFENFLLVALIEYLNLENVPKFTTLVF